MIMQSAGADGGPPAVVRALAAQPAQAGRPSGWWALRFWYRGSLHELMRGSLECPDCNPWPGPAKGLKRLPILARFAEHCALQNVGAWVAMQGCSGTTAGIYPASKTGAAS